jgi:hypothetical protein
MSFAIQVLLRKGKPYTMKRITGHFYFAKIGHYHIAVTGPNLPYVCMAEIPARSDESLLSSMSNLLDY